MTARPLYTAPTVDRSAPTTATVPFTDGVQPRTVPLSVENRNRAAPLDPFWLTTKSVALPLKTVPVGEPGTETGSATFAPVPLYRVERLVPLSDAHQGVVGPALKPQPLTSAASVEDAVTPPSETSGLTVYASVAACAVPVSMMPAAIDAAAASRAIAAANDLRALVDI